MTKALKNIATKNKKRLCLVQEVKIEKNNKLQTLIYFKLLAKVTCMIMDLKFIQYFTGFLSLLKYTGSIIRFLRYYKILVRRKYHNFCSIRQQFCSKTYLY